MSDYIGEIRIFAGNFAPQGWLFCDGRRYGALEYPGLCLLLGNKLDPAGWFAVPDLRGRVLVGTGAGPRLTPRTVGEVGGAESVLAEIPVHSHDFIVSNVPADTNSPQGKSLAAVVASGSISGLYVTVKRTDAALAADCVVPNAGDIPHDNNMPSIALNFIICADGLYPFDI